MFCYKGEATQIGISAPSCRCRSELHTPERAASGGQPGLQDLGFPPTGVEILPAASCKLEPGTEPRLGDALRRLLAHPLLVNVRLFPAPYLFKCYQNESRRDF